MRKAAKMTISTRRQYLRLLRKARLIVCRLSNSHLSKPVGILLQTAGVQAEVPRIVRSGVADSGPFFCPYSRGPSQWDALRCPKAIVIVHRIWAAVSGLE